MTSVAYEPMARRDIDAVRAIDEAVYPNPWTAATWRKELDASDRLHLVALDGDTVIGHAGLLFVLDEVHVTTVATHPSREGEGVATGLLVRLLRAAREHGSTSATLEVRSSERRPQRLYSRFGFRPAGVRRAYYRDPTDDGLVMWLHDLDTAEVGRRLAALADDDPGEPLAPPNPTEECV